MTQRGEDHPGQQAAVRRGRRMLYTAGGVLVAFALVLDLEPSLAAIASPLRVRVLALAGALFLALGRFGSSPFLAGLGRRGGRPG
jgi:hypothetical protein